MHPMAGKERFLLSLPGVLGGVFAIIIGCLVLVFAYPSLGRQADWGYALSPAAGAMLFILLGLAGGLGAALAAESRTAVRGLKISGILICLIFLGILAFYREWAASIAVVIILTSILATIPASAREAHGRKTGTALLFFTGLAGFPLGQAAMTFLPYGWKTWAVSGVLLVFCGILFLAGKNLSRLPLLEDGSSERGSALSALSRGYLLYTLASLLLISLCIAALIHVPADAGMVADRTAELQGGPLNAGIANDRIPGSDACDCMNGTPQKPKAAPAPTAPAALNCSGGQTAVRILSPGDVRTFPRGKQICFAASVCKKASPDLLWWSSIDGIIGNEERFNTSNLSVGWHKITLAATDRNGTTASDYIEIGIAAPWVCSKVSPRPKYYPIDTPCRDIWPNATEECQQLEVCHPDLDYIVADAVKACEDYDGDKKLCRGLYIIRAFGPQARYMQGYALFKTCCSGYPECTRTCWPGLAGTCPFREGFNGNVRNISCRPDEWGVFAWHSDTNMSENSAVLGLFPTHATVNILQTGVCIDYAAAVTTLLRKAGYSKTEAMSTASTGYDLPLLGNHPGHAYNVVLLPGDDRYHIVDTTGNGEGINEDGVPHYFYFTGCFLGQPVKIRVFDWWVGYCTKTSQYGYNDAGDLRTPEKEKICGCS